MLKSWKESASRFLHLLTPENPSFLLFALMAAENTQTLPTALNHAVTAGMLTAPCFGLCALAAHSSGVDNGELY